MGGNQYGDQKLVENWPRYCTLTATFCHLCLARARVYEKRRRPECVAEVKIGGLKAVHGWTRVLMSKDFFYVWNTDHCPNVGQMVVSAIV